LDYRKHDLFNRDSWNRRTVNIYWVIFLIYFIMQFVSLLIRINLGEPIKSFLLYHIIIPDTVYLTILICSELYLRYSKKRNENIIIYISVIISFTLVISISPDIHGTPVILIMPLIVSIAYFSRFMILFCSFNTILFLAALLLLSPAHRAEISVFEFILHTGVILGGLSAGIGVLNRGLELFKNLEKLIQSEQELIMQNAVIDKLSKTDALTGLYNHKTFHVHLEHMVEQCEANSIPMQLAILDIDNFKDVNDTYGHWTGDLVLKKVAQLLKESVLPDDFIARYGGEEFAIVFMRGSLDEAYTTAESLRQIIANHHYSELDNQAVTVSIGLHEYAKGEYKEGLFNAADSLLYKAKKSGKNKVITR
jgi:diguanylate cyclase (GGDEF)-like protein